MRKSKFLASVDILQPVDFNISTWLSFGAAFQIVLLSILPRNVALFPAIALLTFKTLRTFLMVIGAIPNPTANGVFKGMTTGQILQPDGTFNK